MDERLWVLAVLQGGVFTHGQARAYGYSDRAIAAAVAGGDWQRLRPGAYAQAGERCGRAERHRLRVRSVIQRFGDDPVVSHLSAAVLWGWPVWHAALDDVWLTRAGQRTGYLEDGIRHCADDLAADHVTEVGGVRRTTPERTMVDVARVTSFEEATVMLDAALRAGADRELARRILRRCRRWPAARRIAGVLDFADGRAATVLQSRVRVFCAVHQLPRAVPQVEVRGARGRVRARADLVLEGHRVALHCDELTAGVLAGDQGPSELPAEGGRRADHVRDAGFDVVPVSRHDLDCPGATLGRIGAALRRAEPRRSAEAG